MMTTLDKDPDDILDYLVDFSRWLPESDIIEAAVVEIDGDVTEAQAADVADTGVRVWIAGGTAGDTATITVRATTAGGRTKDYSFKLRIKEA